MNLLKNSGFGHGIEGWAGYTERATLTDSSQERSDTGGGRRAARKANTGAPKAIGIGQGDLTIRFAPAGYQAAAISARGQKNKSTRGGATAIRAVCLGSDIHGFHPLNGRVSGARLNAMPLSSLNTSPVGREGGL